MNNRLAVLFSLLLLAAADAFAACEVRPASRYVSRSYAGGTSTLSVTAACEWSVSLTATWVRVTGPTTFNGNGTVTFQFDPLPFEVTDTAANGRSTTFTIGDRTMTIHQSGWRTVGTDVNRDGKADLLWRNKFNGLTWMQPMNGLTPGTGTTLGDASAPNFPGPDWRITTTRTATFGWEIYWRNFTTFQTRRQSMNGAAQFGDQFTFPPHYWHDQTAGRFLGAGQFSPSLTEVLRWNATVSLTNAFTGTDRELWVEWYMHWQIVGVDDFDGDQLLDILWHQPVAEQSNPGTVYMMLEPGGAMQRQVVHREPNVAWRPVAVGDLTGDAKADVIWRNMTDGRVWVQAMDGFTTIGGAILWQEGNQDWQIQGVADFNGDGRKDILWRNTATGLVYGMLIGENLTIASRGTVHHEPGRSWNLVSPTTAEGSQRGNVVPGCGYNAKLTAPNQVHSFSTGNTATVSTSAVPQPAAVDWSVQNGTITSESNTSAQFTAPRSGTLTLTVTLGDGQTCTDTLSKQIPVVYSCTVTPKSTYVGVAYAGGQTKLDVEAAAGCTWTAALPPNSPSWLRIVGPATFTGNGTVTFEADALPYNTTDESTTGRSTTVWIADKDLKLNQSGWENVGTDFNRDGKADILWRNKAHGITWITPMNGLTRGTGITLADASTPNFNAEWRVLGARSDGAAWEIYWNNTHIDEAWYQPMNGTSQAAAPERIIPRTDNDLFVGIGAFRSDLDGIMVQDPSSFAYCAPVQRCTFIGWMSSDAWKTVAVDDFDADLFADMVWHNQVTGTVFMVKDAIVLGKTVTERSDTNWKIVAAGDVNGDAKADLIWRNTATGVMEIMALDGARVVSTTRFHTEPDPNWKIQGMADLNGDGTKDLIWRRATTGLVWAQLLKRDFTVLASGVVHSEPDLNWQIASPTTSARMQEQNVNP